MNQLCKAYVHIQEKIRKKEAGDGAADFLANLKQRWQGYAQAYRVVGHFPLIEGVESGDPIPFEEARKPAPRVSYVDLMLAESEDKPQKPTSYAEAMQRQARTASALKDMSWFTNLPRGIQYRLYENICSKRLGKSEKQLLALHEKDPTALYYKMFGVPFIPVGKKEVTPTFIRNRLFNEFVQERLRRYPVKDLEILKAIQHSTIVYNATDNHSVLASSMKRVNKKVLGFLSENALFLSYVHQQAVAVGRLEPVQDSSSVRALSWAKEHFLEDTHIFYQAITRWYDALPMAPSRVSRVSPNISTSLF
jgi:hypothetical protein